MITRPWEKTKTNTVLVAHAAKKTKPCHRCLSMAYERLAAIADDRAMKESLKRFGISEPGPLRYVSYTQVIRAKLEAKARRPKLKRKHDA